MLKRVVLVFGLRAAGVERGEKEDVRSDFSDLDAWSFDTVAFRRLGGGVRGLLVCAVGALAWH